MPSYVGFLRAVNVGKRQVKMADLRQWLADDGFTDVETYIQTGNVRVGTPLRSRAKVTEALERSLQKHCGFDVPTIVFTPKELAQVYADAVAMEPPKPAGSAEARRFVVFFKDPPTAAEVTQCASYQHGLERARVIGRAAHIWIGGSFADARIFGELAEIFKPGTNRNLKVVQTLVEKWT